MSAYAGKPHEVKGSPSQQPTPVIIKTGGDLPGGNLDKDVSPVTINLQGKSLVSMLNDDRKWRSAQSTADVGIMNVLIKDGGNDVPPPTPSDPESKELITVQLICGREMLVIGEEAQPGLHRTKLVITSPVGFSITRLGSGHEQWVESRAFFPNDKPPLVIFSQGGHVRTIYQCQTDDVELTLITDWGETG